MCKCIHRCAIFFNGCDWRWYVKCPIFGDRPIGCCNEYCTEYKTRFRVSNIVWDTDGAPVEGLPSHCIVECAGEEEIADTLSDEYGWLVKSFDIEED